MFHTPPPLSKKTKVAIILLVLLIHLFLLLPFVIMDFTFLPQSPLEKKVQELHKKVHKLEEQEPEEWAALKSHATQMSAPVILVDDSNAKKDEEKNEEEPDDLTPSEPEAEELLPEKQPDQKTLDKETLRPTSIDIPEKENTHPVVQKEEKKTAEMQEIKPQQTQVAQQTLIEKKPTPQAPSVAKAMAGRPPKPRPKIPAVAQPRQKQPTTKPAQQQRQKISLAQLAQGFTDHMKHEGDYTISMSGHDNAKATESQLKIGRFLQRIIGSVQNAWRVNTSRYPLSHAVIVSIHFTIVINKNGTLNKVGIDKSSGNQLIDNYIKLIVQDASLAFPSIPDYMSHDICSIRCTLDDIRLPEGPPGYTIRQ